MASQIDATKPATGVPSSKTDLRFNLGRAATELNHGGFYTQTGTGAAERQVQLRFRDAVSLKDFGAVGDGVADDTAAVQAAVNTQRAIYVPAGDYKLTAAIQYQSLRMFGEGAKYATSLPRSLFVGNLGSAEPLFHKTGGYFGSGNTYVGSVSGATGTSVVCRDVGFKNNSATGCCFQTFNNVAPVIFLNCLFSTAFRGLFLCQTFNALVMNCEFVGGVQGSLDASLEAVALYGASHTTAIENSWNACGCAVAMHGTTNIVRGGRIEVCDNVARLGGFSWNNDLSPDEVFRNGVFSDLSLEGNNRGVLIADVKYLQMHGLRGLGYVSSEWMIKILKIDPYSTFERLSGYGSWSKAVVINSGARTVPGEFSNSASGRPLYSNLGSSLANISGWYDGQILGGQNLPHPTRFAAETDHDRKLISYFSNLTLRGLKGLSYASALQPNNLGRLDTVTNGATTLAVTFENTLNTGLVSLTGASAAANGSSTLPAGTYYYANTIVSASDGTENGNVLTTLNTHYRTVTTTSGQQVNLTFGVRTWPSWLRRVYRGTALDLWQGFWDMPVSQSTFADDGLQAFTGVGAPNTNATGTLSPLSKAEPDASYAIVATPSWGTTVWVTAKATSGFTLNFGTAAPDANQTVQWLLFRP